MVLGICCNWVTQNIFFSKRLLNDIIVNLEEDVKYLHSHLSGLYIYHLSLIRI